MGSHRDPAYMAYISSPQWKTKREQAFKKYGRACQKCRRTDHLDVHHVTYKRFTKERVEDLRVLCRECHEQVHLMVERDNMNIYQATEMFLRKNPPKQKRTKRKRKTKYLWQQGYCSARDINGRHCLMTSSTGSDYCVFHSDPAWRKQIASMRRKAQAKR